MGKRFDSSLKHPGSYGAHLASCSVGIRGSFLRGTLDGA